jgi:adenylate cyclase class 2
MAAVETEIKFRVEDLASLVDRLPTLGFHLITPRAFESNVLFDTPDRSLRAVRSILRIRHYNGKWILTHKRLPDSGIGEDRHKHRIETETELASGEALAEVFRNLGLVEAFRYEKFRAEWSDDQGHCVIDETPIGIFAELEGPSDWIDSVSAALGLAPSQLMTDSYGRLFEQWRNLTGSTANDLTFAAVATSIPAIKAL